MTVSEARAAALAVLGELPQQVHDALERVSLRVVDRPPPQVPSDVKGIFLGQQQVGAPDDADGDDDDDAAGAWFDLGPSGDLELAAVGGGMLAEGTIFLVAPNLSDPADLEQVAYHEISHALGLDEEGAAELGL